MSLLGEGLFGPAFALFPTIGEGECSGEENDNWNEVTGLGRAKGWVSTEVNGGNGGDTHGLQDQT